MDAPKKPASSPFSGTPIKGIAQVGSSDLVTPEKSEPLPRRCTARRSVAFSVKDVRQAAIGLRKNKERSDLDDLATVEKQLNIDSPTKSRKGCNSRSQIELPPKFQTLYEIFNSMLGLIRLIRLKNYMPSFRNLSASLQNLDHRQNLTYKHLAQMKHILPEVIILKKILSRDENTCCMRPELQITLNHEGLEINPKDEGINGYLLLRNVFKQRLVDLMKDHSQEDDIPEAELPHPFETKKPNIFQSTPRKANNSTPVLQNSEPQSVLLSHMAPSFKSRFSKRTPIIQSISTKIPDEPEQKKSSLVCPSSPSKDCSSNIESEKATPAKSVISTPMRLMAPTPELKTSQTKTRKSIPCPETSSRKSARTKLFTSPNKITKQIDVDNTDDGDEIGFLPKSLMQSIKEKVRKVKEAKEGGTEKIKRRRMIKLLPSTLNSILLLIGSIDRSVLTKQELIHCLISRNLRINDPEEAEEQLKLLQEIVPNWISEKPSHSGDLLYRVDRLMGSEEIHQRLAQAN